MHFWNNNESSTHHEMFSHLSNISKSRRLYIRDTCGYRNFINNCSLKRYSRPKLIDKLLEFSQHSSTGFTYYPTWNGDMNNGKSHFSYKSRQTNTDTIKKEDLSVLANVNVGHIQQIFDNLDQTTTELDPLEQKADILSDLKIQPYEISFFRHDISYGIQNMSDNTKMYNIGDSFTKSCSKNSCKKNYLYEMDSDESVSSQSENTNINRLIDILNSIDNRNDWSDIDYSIGLMDEINPRFDDFFIRHPSTIIEENSTDTNSEDTYQQASLK